MPDAHRPGFGLTIASAVFALAACSPQTASETLEADPEALNVRLVEAARTNEPLPIKPGVGVGPVEFGIDSAPNVDPR